MLKIGQKIREIRLEKGMTQAVLAQKLNVRQNLISQWETGWCEPHADMIRQIAVALGCDANALFDMEN